MTTNWQLRRVSMWLVGIVLAGTFSLRLGSQEYLLPKMSPDVRALNQIQSDLRMSSINSLDPLGVEVKSPDSQKLDILNQAASTAADNLRGATDLLAVYDNLQSDDDRKIVKPLLIDRLRMYSRVIALQAEMAAVPLGTSSQPSTTKRALKLRDDLLSVKSKLDSISASLS
jgi:hypothetical protein